MLTKITEFNILTDNFYCLNNMPNQKHILSNHVYNSLNKHSIIFLNLYFKICDVLISIKSHEKFKNNLFYIGEILIT